MKDDDGTAMVNSAKDTANPDDGKETPVKATEWSQKLQTERRTRMERRDPHGVRAGNPDRRTPDRREIDQDSGNKE